MDEKLTDQARTAPTTEAAEETATAAVDAAEEAAADSPSGSTAPSTAIGDGSAEATIRKKPRRSLWAALIIAAIALVALFAFLICSTTADRQMGEQAISDLRASGALEQLAIPSSWQDQTGFEADTVRMESVSWDRSATPEEATVELVAEIDNGQYEGQVGYLMRYIKEDGHWQQADQTEESREYEPAAPLADGILTANIGRFIAEVDTETSVLPQMILSPLFDGETTAEVLSNESTGRRSADVTLSIHRLYDGIPYEGELTASLIWDSALPDGPDWKIVSATANEDAYEAVMTIPHEGLSWFRSDSSIEQVSSEPLSSWEFVVYYPEEMEMREGSLVARGSLENVAKNSVDLEAVLSLAGSGEAIATAPRLSPNTTLEALRLTHPLEPGAYPVHLNVTAYARGTDRIEGTMDKDITLTVDQAAS